jgi:hypothetical protein
MSYCMDTHVAHVFLCQVTGCNIRLPESLPERTWALVRDLIRRFVTSGLAGLRAGRLLAMDITSSQSPIKFVDFMHPWAVTLAPHLCPQSSLVARSKIDACRLMSRSRHRQGSSL